MQYKLVSLLPTFKICNFLTSTKKRKESMKLLLLTSLCLLATNGFADSPSLSAKTAIDLTIIKIKNSPLSEDYYPCIGSEEVKNQMYDNFSEVREFGEVVFHDLSDVSVAKFALKFHNSLPLDCGFGNINIVKRAAMREILNANNWDTLGSLDWN